MSKYVNIIEEVLEKEFYLRKGTEGYYEETIYTDYSDTMEAKTILEILGYKNPRGCFNDTVYELYSDTEFDIIDNYTSSVRKELELLDIEYTDADEEEIREYLNEHVYIIYPHNHFENQKVCANLILDAGDGNSDFSENTAALTDEDFEFSDTSSLLWLAIQQGYTREQLTNAITKAEYGDSAFLKSCYEEVLNTTSSMNAVTFFIETTLGDLLDYSENKTDLTISADTNCGLVDYWYGAGGSLDIQLEKEVVVPKNIIDSFSIDGDRGSYSVDSIYGLGENFWNGTVK